MSMSGWWPAASAAAATSLTNTIAPGEVGTHEGLDELVAPTLPTGQVLQALGDRGVIQPCMAPPSRRMSGVIFALLTATEPT
jgi:hypothetical protein